MKCFNLYKYAYRNKLDLLAKNITRYIMFNYLKDFAKSNEYTLDIKIDDMQFTELATYGTKRIFIFIQKEQAVNRRGEWIYDMNNIRIEDTIGRNIPIKNQLKDFSEFLKYQIRHEMQHALQTKLDPATIGFVRDISITDESPLLDKIKEVKRYLLTNAEKEAYIRDLMLKAKNERKPIEQIITNFVKQYFYETDLNAFSKNIDSEKISAIFKEIVDKYKEEVKRVFIHRNIKE